MTEKIRIGKNVFVFPMPVTLLGVNVGGRANFMALGWVTRVNANPPLIGCGVGRHHYTVSGLKENQTFSINFPDASMIEKVDYCGLVSGEKVDKTGLFPEHHSNIVPWQLLAERTGARLCVAPMDERGELMLAPLCFPSVAVPPQAALL